MASWFSFFTLSSNRDEQGHVKSLAFTLSSTCSYVLKVANVNRISDIIYSRFIKFCNSGVMSSSSFVTRIFKDSCSLAYTGIGYNFMFGHSHLQDVTFTDRVTNVSKIIRSIRSVFGFISPF